MSILRAIVYSRHSSDKQNPNSSADQAQACGLLAERLGATVAAAYSDPEVSGYRRNRPGLLQLLRYVDAGRVDLIICETVASLAHARAIMEAALSVGLPVWLSVTVDDRDGTKLRSGEAVADVCEIGAGAGALLANCSAPEAMGAALDALKAAGKPFGAYANGFTQITANFLKDSPTVDALSARRDLSPAIYAQYALAWVAQGATIVGGCCEVGPAHITELARVLTAAGHRIV